MKKVCFFVVLAMVVVAGVFALTDEQINSAARMGYLAGYTASAPNARDSQQSYAGTGAANNYADRVNSNRSSLDWKQAYDAYYGGFIQGWNDKKEGKPNRFF
ncbi:MAG: hypothetical protein FWC12_12375 [Treponema sp.]|nr:hypothetical protein [Treponema sp.]